MSNIYKKLLDIKKEVPYLQKDTDGYNYSYASPEKVLRTLNPKLNEHGLFVTTEVVDTDVYGALEKDNGKWVKSGKNLIQLTVEMKITDVEEEESITLQWAGYGYNDGEKGFGSALTYAERYFLLKLFNIPTGDDDPDARQKKAEAQDESLQEDINNGDIDF